MINARSSRPVPVCGGCDRTSPTRRPPSLFSVWLVASCLLFCAGPTMAVAEETEDSPEPVKPVLSVGDTAPTFFLNAVNADRVGRRRIVLEDEFRDEGTRAVVISFFATWCPPCLRELPLLQSIYERYREKGLRVLVVSIDREPESLEELSRLIEEIGVDFPVVSDRFVFLARRYLGATTALPAVFIADGDGVLQTIHQGYDDDAEAFLEGEVRRILGVSSEPAEDRTAGEDSAAGPDEAEPATVSDESAEDAGDAD